MMSFILFIVSVTLLSNGQILLGLVAGLACVLVSKTLQFALAAWTAGKIAGRAARGR